MIKCYFNNVKINDVSRCFKSQGNTPTNQREIPFTLDIDTFAPTMMFFTNA